LLGSCPSPFILFELEHHHSVLRIVQTITWLSLSASCEVDFFFETAVFSGSIHGCGELYTMQLHFDMIFDSTWYFIGLCEREAR